MAFEFRTNRRIEFVETDMAGIVHFSNYFRYMEETEHQFLRSLGLSTQTEINGKIILWPRVRAECRYNAPLAFEEIVEIRLLVRDKKRKSITYDFDFSKRGGPFVARGFVKVLCVAMDPVTKKMTPINIPEVIGEKIEIAPI
jgi:YbgC/YbaW family acyl-CoA thioester hydrolase